LAFHVVTEAKRCLRCKNPTCRQGCPIGTDIPDVINLFLQSKLDKAGEMLFNNNPLSVVCSLVCNHDNQCEGNCVLGRKGSPVHFSSIENYISESYLGKLHTASVPKKGINCAIIGSGPAGITIAILLVFRGYDVTIFESRERVGGVLRYGIPAFRLPKDILNRYENLLMELGVVVRPNTTIGGAITIDDLFRDGYKAIFISTGVWRPRSLHIKGESLGNVHFAINYLANPDVYHLGKRVIIIGSGNSAIDVARTAIRKGSRNVSIFCRHDAATAGKREIEYAKIDGVEFAYCMTPVEITKDGIWCSDTNDKSEGTKPYFYPADNIIVSIGQLPKNKIVSTTYGLDIDGNGLLVTKNGQTSRKGVFASGDVVIGAKTVVDAVKYSKQVVDEMEKYILRSSNKTGEN
jgi:glutamate synthase (NADPH) small chain